MPTPWFRNRKNDRATRRPQIRRSRPLIESLEGRQMLSTFNVTTTADTSATGTLRWAITQSNMTTGPNTIDFKISGMGLQTINLTSPLPKITQPATIDGTTQTGYSATPVLAPVIVLNGASAGKSAVGLEITASGSTVKGLVIDNFGGDGVEIVGVSKVTITDDLIGLNAAGNAAAANGGSGVNIENAATNNTISANVISGNIGNGVEITGIGTTGNVVTGSLIGTNVQGSKAVPNNGGAGVNIESGASLNTVGGTTAGSRNVISGNNSETAGVGIYGGSSNLVEGNYIGTDSTGQNGVSNGVGVFISNSGSFGASSNTIGGTSAAARNVVSASASYGVFIYNTKNNLVEGDYIGTNAAGTAALGNNEVGFGVYIQNATGNTVGGTVAGSGNVISGNTASGVDLGASSANVIEGNFIGTDHTGEKPLGNAGSGVYALQSSANTIGGTTAGARNVISANGGSGVELYNSSNNLVEGDYIGTDATGTTAYSGANRLGNQGDGVLIHFGSTANTIGGTAAGALNVISGNLGNGVEIDASSSNLVESSYIGTDLTGSKNVDTSGKSLGNSGSGLLVHDGSQSNSIGSTTSTYRVVVSNNAQQGIEITDGGTAHNVVKGTYVGTNAAGTAAFPNGSHGVLITLGASYNTVGGTTSAARDVISGNTYNGVAFSGSSTEYNVVEGDYIGTNAAGTAAVGNSANGVFFSGAPHNTIGGTVAGSGDVISGNLSIGVWITSGASDELIEGNYIGTDYTGAHSVPNYNGVQIDAASTANTIGGTTSAARDVISGNSMWGLYITDAGTSGNVVEGDYIGTNGNGTAAVPNHANGLDIIADATENTIGGTVSAARNIISGNSYTGVTIYGAPDNFVQGNYIGTSANGSAAIPNGGYGVDVYAGSIGNMIGGSTPASRNVISGNAEDGVLISDSGTYGNWVEYDYIGTDYTGSVAIPNGGAGVAIQAGAVSNAIYYNVISGNTGDGVLITDSGTTNNVVVGDLIGVNASDNAIVHVSGLAYSNDDGVQITNGASYNTVSFSVISGNFNGVEIDGSSTVNVIASDDIGTDSTGTLVLGNFEYGVVLIETAGNDVEYNSIEFNGAYGILLWYSDANDLVGNLVNGNTDGSVIQIG